ncbi:MAG: PEP-utilizing enzyme [Anaerolineae bacterium]|nr:PEP-utilizing enzyme [Anaerolineae bacterium]
MSTILGSSELILSLAGPRATLDVVGGKGASLARLVVAGLPVPEGFHVTTAAYNQFVAEAGLQPSILVAMEGVSLDRPGTLEVASAAIRERFVVAQMPASVAGAIALAYAGLPGTAPPVAVRSSATAEDLPEASFAGQQDTYLNVQGIAQVLESVKRCWASLWTARAIGYRARQGIAPGSVSIAVVVQILVPAEAAGILFTADPVNGRRDQAMVSAAWGLGEAVVGGLVTPDTLIVDKASGSIVEQTIADKQVMTVRTATGTEEQPVPEALRCAPVLDAAHAAELVRLGTRIEALYGVPVDIEWALADDAFAILQARPVTALPEPPLPAVEWKVPRPKGQYMRGSLVDLLPHPVSPLFATLAIPTIFRVGVKEVLRPLTGSEPNLPDDYITTINGYAYMGVGYTPPQWWWIVTRMMLAMPRMLRESLPLWRDVIRPGYAATVARRQDDQPDAMSPAELWAGVRELNDAAMLHLASLLVATTGASAGAEGLFTGVYGRLVRREGDPAAPAFLMGYDSTPIRAEKSLYDLAAWGGQDAELKEHLLKAPTERLAAQLEAGSAPVAGWTGFCERFHEHQMAFGHIIYDLDFARPLPLDDPSPELETIRMYLRGDGVNPYERQAAAETKRVKSSERIGRRLRGLRRWAFEKTLRIAQSMAQVRENALSDIGLGYPLLRRFLRELGGRFVRSGWILRDEDVFWLEAGEVEAAVGALETGASQEGLAERVAERREMHRALMRVIPPPMIPPRKKYMGIDMTAFTPATEGSQAGDSLKGIAASGGVVTAPAQVLHGPEDFDLMEPGAVLVAATTTPAWTPLFAMASAVVTDIGGPLSHGSIVAREYGIPAVLGTGVATRRIRSGQTITVDGDSGVVTLGSL